MDNRAVLFFVKEAWWLKLGTYDDWTLRDIFWWGNTGDKVRSAHHPFLSLHFHELKVKMALWHATMTDHSQNPTVHFISLYLQNMRLGLPGNPNPCSVSCEITRPASPGDPYCGGEKLATGWLVSWCSEDPNELSKGEVPWDSSVTLWVFN